MLRDIQGAAGPIFPGGSRVNRAHSSKQGLYLSKDHQNALSGTRAHLAVLYRLLQASPVSRGIRMMPALCRSMTLRTWQIPALPRLASEIKVMESAVTDAGVGAMTGAPP